VTGVDVLERSPLEFASGLYVAVSGVLPDPNCEMVNAHDPAPAVRAPGQESGGLKPSDAVTVPVALALPDAGCTLKFTVTGFPTSATFVGRANPLKLEAVDVMVVVVAVECCTTVKVTLTLPVQPFESVAVTVNGKLPVWVGVPLSTPATKLMPVGKAPLSDSVVVPTPPLSVNVTAG
jgi:hypothetical protein